MIRLLFGQLCAAGWAAVIFRVGLEPQVAGVLAGSVFILVGVYGVWAGYHWEGRARLRWMRFAVLAMSLGHLAVFALPMLSYRIIHWDEIFSKIEFWGLSGPEFHAVSTRYFAVWMMVVLTLAVTERLQDRARLK